MKNTNRIFCLVLCVVLLLGVLPLTASALDVIDTTAEASLELHYVHEDTPLAEVPFDIYRVASVDGYGSFTVLAPFLEYPLDFSDMTQDKWAVLANTLAGYVQRDALTPTAFGATDSNGTLTFDGLETGLYLVIGARSFDGTYFYTPAPSFVCLPSVDAQTGEWDYHPVINPKMSVKEHYNNEKTTRKVLKVWNDNGNTSSRPAEITVELLCDGKTYATVKLNKDNKWSYEWTDLDKNHNWTVIEHEVKGYTVETVTNGITITLTNTPENPEPPPHNPPDVPQTGLLWWPVPILFGAGLLFLMVALIYKRKAANEKET